MTYFPFKCWTFNDAGLLTSGSLDGGGGIVSAEDALELATMLGAKALGLYDVNAGEFQLRILRGDSTPKLEEVWAYVQKTFKP